MSREQYQVPTGGKESFGGASGGTNFAAEVHAPIFYTCGDCAVRVPLEKGAPIRCQKCGARVLYKERTKRMVQFEAR
ncbi:hypothetical protein B0T22DRAFT_478881 [Podospora appendiculata]|uniref:Metallothionein-I gene transcription activator n=1 Tax=Podospora appendiculata TaxID=314037 RepID=A0AAE0X860_9PEZI|nr:hypothetical protein B0T22DRAFT_478881 [Podospora appendiculata]